MTKARTAPTGTTFSPTFGHLGHPFLIKDPKQLAEMNEIFELFNADEAAELGGEDGHVLEIRVKSGTIKDALADDRGDELARLLGDVFWYTGWVYVDDTDVVIGWAHGDPTVEIP